MTNLTFAQDSVVTDNSYIPIFRSGHNLSILYSTEYSTWRVSQNVSSTSDEKISSINESRVNAAFFVRYSFHVNVINNFGFFLGTTSGIIIDIENYGNLKQGYGIAFPSLLGGLALNLGQKFRILSGAEYGANWYPDMEITTDSGHGKIIAPVPNMFSVFAGLDYFFTKNKAFTFQLGWREQRVVALNSNSRNTYLNSLSIQNSSYFAQIGLSLQIGDINQAITSVLPLGTN